MNGKRSVDEKLRCSLTKPIEERKFSSRRSFLKTSGTSIAASLVAGAGGLEAQTLKQPEKVRSEADNGEPSGSPVSFVNLLQGNDSTSTFSRGNTLPIAARPFGMAHWTLQSRANTPWMFDPGERRIQGLRSTHQLSPWLGDYGHAVFLPFYGDVDPEPTRRASSYRPEDMKLSPYSLRLHLMRYGVDVELIPTERCALLSVSYSKPEAPGFLFDIPGSDASEIHQDLATRTISFMSSANSGGVPANFATYYVLRFTKRWKSVDIKHTKDSSVGLVRFMTGDAAHQISIGTSFISFEQAQQNLDREIGARSVADLRREGEAVWNRFLGRIEIAGGSVDQHRTFYSCLYRTLLFPRMWHEPGLDNTMHHRSPYTGQIVAGLMYADHGYWDVYRAWYPLMTLLFPDRLAEILQAWVNAYKEGDWLPQFPCPGYRACMTGSLIDSVFGDAAAKGISGFDLETAYKGLKKHALERGSPEAGYGRRGLDEYLKYSYVPAGLVEQSVAETVDAAYGDFCIAQVAKALGHEADSEMFLKRSENWRHLFDPKTGFLRGKNADGTWLEPFDPVTWGDPYVEGAAWQHRWDVPHNIAGLIKAMGGAKSTVKALERMLAMPPDFNVGVYGQEIHEMSEMAAVPFGQYDHGNQPVHHVLYLFAAAGRPDLTRFWTRKVLKELYTPESFAGDEDTGSMAAWFILSALGFYPHCPGKPEYTLGRALFPKATVHLPNGKSLIIEDAMQSEHDGSVVLNGRQITSSLILHTEIMSGGNLRFSS